MQFTGIIREALPVAQGVNQSGREWIRQQFFVESIEERDYKDTIIATVLRKDLLTWMSQNVGRVVCLDIDFRAREYNGRYYQDIICTYARLNDTTSAPQQQYQQQRGNAVYNARNVAQQQNENNMPF